MALAPQSGPSPLGAALDLVMAHPRPPATSHKSDPRRAALCPMPQHAPVLSVLGFNAPPNGIVLETLDQLRAHLPEVQKQVSLRTMPLGNLTGMTDTERATVLMWIGHAPRGALHDHTRSAEYTPSR